MKNYAILRIDKIRTGNDMAHRYNHNMRTYEIDNVDSSLSYLNQDVQDGLNGRTYNEIFNETMTNLKIKGTVNKVRSNAVRGFEVVCRYSREADANLDKEAWIKKNVEWLNRTFNPPGGTMTYKDEDGIEHTVKTNNVKSIVVHNDEGSTHIHAFVVPIDDKGHLNASYYMGHPYMLREMQNNYARSMQEFGLSRGEYKSIATPEQIRAYYTNITKAVDAELPEVEPGESIEEYRERANKAYQIALSNHRNEIVKMNQQIIEATSSTTLSNESLENEIKKNKEIEENLASALGKEDLTREDYNNVYNIVRKDKDFHKAIEEYPDKEKAETIYHDYNEMINWKKKKRKKKHKYKEHENKREKE